MNPMPTTLTALVLAIVLLLPGFTYWAIRERATPDRQRSPFRETTEVIVAGVAADVAALVVGIVAHAITQARSPANAPDISGLILHGRIYLADHYALVALWVVGLLAVASGGAAVVAVSQGPRDVPVSAASAWWQLFQTRRTEIRKRYGADPSIKVGCYLDDNSYVAGALLLHNRAADESPDRDLVLAAPIEYRHPGATSTVKLDADVYCVSARRLVGMAITYSVPPTQSLEPESPESVDSVGGGGGG